MPYSSGTFTLVAGNPVVTGTTISSTWANNTLNDIATALSTAMLKDGTQTATALVTFAQGISTTALTVSGSGNASVGGITVPLGGVRTNAGNSGSIASATPTTIFTPATVGRYDVEAVIPNGAGGNYMAWATLMFDGGASRIVSSNGANLTISLSGNAVQVTQSSGVPATVNWSYVLMPN